MGKGRARSQKVRAGHRRGQRVHRKQEAVSAARASSQAAGCRCRPDIDGSPTHLNVRHDAWCPLADAGRHVVIYWPGES